MRTLHNVLSWSLRVSKELPLFRFYGLLSLVNLILGQSSVRVKTEKTKALISCAVTAKAYKHAEAPWDRRMKVCITCPRRMAKISTMHIYGKSLLKSPEPDVQ